MSHTIITIDGYVATGKGTTALGLARRLGYTYLDTGAMYRAVAWYAYTHGMLDSDEKTKTKMMSQINISFQYNLQTDHDDVYLNGQNIEKEIRQTTLSSLMKPIVVSPVVRSALAELQREISKDRNIIVDGRDMGTVVFPNADFKFFLVGDKQVRAQRRYKEMITRGISVTIEDVLHDITLRDDIDYLGPDAINIKAPDAILIDTTYLTVEQQIEKVYKIVMQ